ncbi:MAG: iron-sulfur cluster assembly accessory protein [Pseudomonadota bacterium]|nr:iron-sulfur cluster assembly accessory protein [Pseudomonadota bacterium]|tara:strand:- start:174 stop:500 length:327 start_codon:yes stop_codon:yes gene_type:complete
MAVSITKSAAKRVQLFMSERKNNVGLRIGVKKTGCSGYAYVVDYADLINADDVIFEEHGVKVVVDPKSLELIDGTEVDFIKEGMNEVFRFRNPKVKGECGCGESFSID